MSSPEEDPLSPGLYERLVDRLLEKRLGELESAGVKVDRVSVDSAELPFLLSLYLEKRLLAALRTLSGESPDNLRIAFANRILALMAASSGESPPELFSPAAMLVSVPPVSSGGFSVLEPPLTGLSESTLLTGAPDDPSLASELDKEIRSADRIDILTVPPGEPSDERDLGIGLSPPGASFSGKRPAGGPDVRAIPTQNPRFRGIRRRRV